MGLATAALAFVGARLVRIYALRQNLLDIPNARSSHEVPTPRGGGLAIVAAFFIGLFAAAALGLVERDLLFALAGGGVLVAAAGFADDHGGLSVRLRLALHFAAAIWAVIWLGGWPELDLGFATLAWGAGGYVIGAVGLVWLLNLYNFMDGIDGIAGSEAVFVALAGALFVTNAGGSPLVPVLLAASAFGFLCLNWPPAHIFMGDVGSGFLGFVLGVVALHAVTTQLTAPWPWLILIGVFALDAALTLFRRAIRKEQWWTAHRTHAYQRAARKYGAHRPVVVGVLAVDCLWLLPCAIAAALFPQWAIAIALLALAPLLLLVRHFGAGEAESGDE